MERMVVMLNWKAYWSRNSFKNRIMIMLFLITFVPIFSIGLISYNTFMSILEDKLSLGLQNNLAQFRMNLENNFGILGNTSNFIAYTDQFGRELSLYFDNQTGYGSTEIMNRLDQQVSLLEFTNNLNCISIYYYDKSGKIRLLNTSMADLSRLSPSPFFFRKGSILFYGPHRTASSNNDYLVVSTTQRVNLSGNVRLYVYAETAYKQLNRLLQEQKYPIKGYQLLLNSKNQVVYTQNRDIIGLHATLDAIPKKFTGRGDGRTYYTFSESGSGGWKLVLFVPVGVYNSDLTIWTYRFALIAVLSLMLSALFSVLIWIMIFNPIKRFNRQLRQIVVNNAITDVEKISVSEFDEYLKQFLKMKSHILLLMEAVKKETQQKSMLEVQQLFYKINPHFLLNTLDTLRWQAKLKNEPELVNMTSSLIKLLYYNLQSEEESTLMSELSAIREYMLLQQSKYELEFVEHIELDSELMKVKMPKFILQPLLENAIFHGIEGNGRIELNIESTAGIIIIRIIDFGC